MPNLPLHQLDCSVLSNPFEQKCPFLLQFLIAAIFYRTDYQILGYYGTGFGI